MRHIQILSNARSGSSYLWHVIRKYVAPTQTPHAEDLLHLEEPFEELHIKKRFPDEIPGQIMFRRIDHIRNNHNVVVKNHNNQLNTLSVDYPHIYKEYLKTDPKTIVLIRRDLFETTLSHCIARELGQWYSYEKVDPITIKPQSLTSLLFNRVNNTIQLAMNSHGFDYTEVVYYEDFKGWPRADFAQLDICPVDESMLRPIKMEEVGRAPDKREVVRNYDELKRVAEDSIENLRKRNMLKNLTVEGTTITHVEFDK